MLIMLNIVIHSALQANLNRRIDQKISLSRQRSSKTGAQQNITKQSKQSKQSK